MKIFCCCVVLLIFIIFAWSHANAQQRVKGYRMTIDLLILSSIFLDSREVSQAKQNIQVGLISVGKKSICLTVIPYL